MCLCVCKVYVKDSRNLQICHVMYTQEAVLSQQAVYQRLNSPRLSKLLPAPQVLPPGEFLSHDLRTIVRHYESFVTIRVCC